MHEGKIEPEIKCWELLCESLCCFEYRAERCGFKKKRSDLRIIEPTCGLVHPGRLFAFRLIVSTKKQIGPGEPEPILAISANLRQFMPLITPSSSMSILKAAGVLPMPGMSIMSPHTATKKPAPAEMLISRT